MKAKSQYRLLQALKLFVETVLHLTVNRVRVELIENHRNYDRQNIANASHSTLLCYSILKTVLFQVGYLSSVFKPKNLIYCDKINETV